MSVRPLGIAGTWEFVPTVYDDDRGAFAEWFRGAEFEDAVGIAMPLAQANVSVSRRGVIRGIHFSEVPPGQAKYVTCVRGAVLDVAIDVRVGSPTFGRWEGVELTARSMNAIYLAAGLGHAFCALTDDATVAYLCSTPYEPTREHAVHPLDPAIGIVWPAGEPVLSAKDAAAPTLQEARDQGLLPSYG